MTHNARDLLDALTDHADLAGFTEEGEAILHLTLPASLFETLCIFSPLDEAGRGKQAEVNHMSVINPLE